MKYLKLLRVKHYLKNFIILLPLIFSGNMFELELYPKLILSFFSFSLIASSIYVYNDICDYDSDKNHEVKKKRPIASGEVSMLKAKIILVAVFIVGLIMQYISNKYNIYSWIYLLSYFIINILYSKKLKQIPLLDVIIIVMCFIIRMLYGAAVFDIEISNWLYLTVMSFSFFLAFGKRRNEIIKSKGNSRAVLKYYNKEFLDKNMYMCLTLGITFYSLWAINFSGIGKGSLPGLGMNLTIPIVLITALKYSLEIEKESYGDPVDVILSDKILLALAVVYIIVCFISIYL